MTGKPRILIIRFSSIGDIVLTTPIVRCLKKQLAAEIHYLTKKNYHALLSANPYVDRIHLMEDSIKNSIGKLRDIKFDFIIDLHKNLRSFKVRNSLDSQVHSFDKINLSKWLMVNLRFNRLPDKHIVDRYFGATEKLGVSNDDQGLDAFYLENATLRHPPLPYVVLAIGGAHTTKKLPLQQLHNICRRLHYPIAIVGGPEDQIVASALASKCAHVRNYVGQTDLQGSIQLIDQSDLVISHDTGMMHISAALKKPILSIWGNTIPAFGMYPYYPKDIIVPSAIFEVQDLKCRPCSKIGYEQCPRGHFKCMKLQDIDAIVTKANKILQPRS